MEFILISNKENLNMLIKINKILFYIWGLGIGDWGLGPIPNPQSPIPNPQSPYNISVEFILNSLITKINFLLIIIK